MRSFDAYLHDYTKSFHGIATIFVKIRFRPSERHTKNEISLYHNKQARSGSLNETCHTKNREFPKLQLSPLFWLLQKNEGHIRNQRPRFHIKSNMKSQNHNLP